jgi:hypothetical protein
MHICHLASFWYITAEYYNSVSIYFLVMSIQSVCTFFGHCIKSSLNSWWDLKTEAEWFFRAFVIYLQYYSTQFYDSEDHYQQAGNCSGGQEIPCFLGTWMFSFVHRSRLLEPILSLFSAVTIITPYYSKMNEILSSHLWLSTLCSLLL